MGAFAELLDGGAAGAALPSVDPWSERARRFVLGALSQGVSALVENADADPCLLGVTPSSGGAQRLLPVLVPRKRTEARSATDLVSPHAHYIDYSREEIGRRRPGIPSKILDAAFMPLGLTFRLGRGESVVYLNNWLVATNPVLDLGSEEIRAATSAITERHPHRAVVVRSITPDVDLAAVSALRGAGYRLVRSRRVFIIDPTDGSVRKHKDVRTDRGLSRRIGYRIVDEPEVFTSQVEHVVALYRNLYLDKYTRLNPHYTERFFRLTLRERIFEYRAFVRDGSLDAYVGWFVHNGRMTGIVLGHDRSKPRKLGLYRQVIALLIAEAERLGVSLNLSGGVEEFKLHRGAVAAKEYEAIYDRHLKAPRRALWSLIAAAGRVAARRRSRV